MRFELQFFDGEEEEKGEGGRRGREEKKKRRKLKTEWGKGGKRFVHIFLAENSGRIQKVRRHKFEAFFKEITYNLAFFTAPPPFAMV